METTTLIKLYNRSEINYEGSICAFAKMVTMLLAIIYTLTLGVSHIASHVGKLLLKSIVTLKEQLTVLRIKNGFQKPQKLQMYVSPTPKIGLLNQQWTDLCPRLARLKHAGCGVECSPKTVTVCSVLQNEKQLAHIAGYLPSLLVLLQMATRLTICALFGIASTQSILSKCLMRKMLRGLLRMATMLEGMRSANFKPQKPTANAAMNTQKRTLTSIRIVAAGVAGLA
jgi:hypothetical protein